MSRQESKSITPANTPAPTTPAPSGAVGRCKTRLLLTVKSSARILRNVRTAILKIAVRPSVIGWAAGMNEFSIKDIVAHSAKRRTYETKLSQCGARCRIEISGPRIYEQDQKHDSFVCNVPYGVLRKLNPLDIY